MKSLHETQEGRKRLRYLQIEERDVGRSIDHYLGYRHGDLAVRKAHVGHVLIEHLDEGYVMRTLAWSEPLGRRPRPAWNGPRHVVDLVAPRPPMRAALATLERSPAWPDRHGGMQGFLDGHGVDGHGCIGLGCLALATDIETAAWAMIQTQSPEASGDLLARFSVDCAGRLRPRIDGADPAGARVLEIIAAAESGDHAKVGAYRAALPDVADHPDSVIALAAVAAASTVAIVTERASPAFTAWLAHAASFALETARLAAIASGSPQEEMAWQAEHFASLLDGQPGPSIH